MIRSLLLSTLLLLILSTCGTYQHPTAVRTQHYNLAIDTDSIASTSLSDQVAYLLAPYQTELSGRMNEVIGRAARSMPKRKPESPLGNWIADALHQKAALLSIDPVTASIQNYGGIRIPELPAGPISVGKIYELMPFDNTLVIVTLSGVQTQQLFDQIAADGGWPVSKEVQFTMRDGRAQGLRFANEEINPEGTYYVAMPDYIANGGGDCDFLRPLPRLDTGLLIRDILIDHVRSTTYSNERVQAFLDGRILKGS